MHLTLPLLTALVACTMSVQGAASNFDALAERALDAIVDSPSFAVRDSSLMAGASRMRRHVRRSCSSDEGDDDEGTKKKSHKHHKHHGKSKKTKSKSKSKSAGSKATQKPTQKTSQVKTGGKDGSTASKVLGDAKGLIGLTFDGQCKNPDASDKYPNGNINFLNCGISKSNPSAKWSPPNVKMSQLRFISASQAASADVFKPCSKYQSAFEKASSQTNVPAVLLMAFAMQESTCNPSVKGANGEIGMMQLTPDKCSNANCWDATTNIVMGAKYFKSQLDAFNGNALQALGSYNGWQSGMSYSRATSQQYGCYAQNNLDYLNQMLNGWAQGKNGYDMKVYNNLARCG